MIEWDIKIGEDFDEFDPRLSYELTGYRPIDDKEGLDFNPLWFNEAARTYEKTGHYTTYPYNCLAYRKFFNEEYRRCKNGYTVNGYTITGDHYFFLNYYRLLNIRNVSFAGSGRNDSFPSFFTEQYKFFHYLELARKIGLDACLMKARGVGFSEINASVLARSFSVIRESNNIIATYDKVKLTPTLEKVWKCLTFLDFNTDRGFSKLKQVINKADQKKASHYVKVRGQFIEVGFKSMITGIIADNPNKIRGSRAELLIYEEGGCHLKGTKVIMFDKSLKNVEDITVGDLLMGKDGTVRKVLNLHRGKDMMYKLIPVKGDIQIVNSNHIIYGYDNENHEFNIKAKDYYLNKDFYTNYKLVKSELSNLPKEDLTSTFKIEEYGIDDYYGFTIDKDNLFLLKDFTITHNSWDNSKKAFIQGDALVSIQGKKFGTKIIGGTGGDSGKNLSGLRDIYYNYKSYNVLGYRHNWTDDNNYVVTGFFIPAHAMLNVDGYIDHRGYVDPNKGKEFYLKKREEKANDPEGLIIYSAEYCFTAEEAFAMEGTNNFNKALLSEQLTEIRVKRNPEVDKIETGLLSYVYNAKGESKENIIGFKWIKHNDGKIKILEHPVWLENNSEPIDNLYVIGIDSIDLGKRDTSSATRNPSEFCLVVKKRIYGLSEPKIVCIYKDRPDNIRTAYELAIRIAQYYNAKINIEASRTNLISWADNNGYLHLFMRRPKITLTDIKHGKTSQYGTPATERIIEHQLGLIADFVFEYSHTIWFEEIIDELLRYTYENKTHFDIVAALGMVMIADEELRTIAPKKYIKEDGVMKNKIGYYTDSDGYKRFGVIPNNRKNRIIVNLDYNVTRMTSDPYYHNY